MGNKTSVILYFTNPIPHNNGGMYMDASIISLKEYMSNIEHNVEPYLINEKSKLIEVIINPTEGQIAKAEATMDMNSYILSNV